jgi:hypothetical protein
MDEQAEPTTEPVTTGWPSSWTVRVGMLVLALLFVAWAAAFVREASFVSSDGVRRYCLFDDAMVSMRSPGTWSTASSGR